MTLEPGRKRSAWRWCRVVLANPVRSSDIFNHEIKQIAVVNVNRRSALVLTPTKTVNSEHSLYIALRPEWRSDRQIECHRLWLYDDGIAPLVVNVLSLAGVV
jgi:hypothetical protein